MKSLIYISLLSLLASGTYARDSAVESKENSHSLTSLPVYDHFLPDTCVGFKFSAVASGLLPIQPRSPTIIVSEDDLYMDDQFPVSSFYLNGLRLESDIHLFPGKGFRVEPELISRGDALGRTIHVHYEDTISGNSYLSILSDGAETRVIHLTGKQVSDCVSIPDYGKTNLIPDPDMNNMGGWIINDPSVTTLVSNPDSAYCGKHCLRMEKNAQISLDLSNICKPKSNYFFTAKVRILRGSIYVAYHSSKDVTVPILNSVDCSNGEWTDIILKVSTGVFDTGHPSLTIGTKDPGMNALMYLDNLVLNEESTLIDQTVSASALSTLNGDRSDLIVTETGHLEMKEGSRKFRKIMLKGCARLSVDLGADIQLDSMLMENLCDKMSSFVNMNTDSKKIVAHITQQFDSARTWYLSLPIATCSLKNAGLDSTEVKYYDEQFNTWKTCTDSIRPGVGYVCFSPPKNLAMSGIVNDGKLEISLWNNPGTNPAYAGFNLIGNPYPSYLDAESMFAAFNANSGPKIESSIWYRTRFNDNYIFETVNTRSGLVASPKFSSAACALVPPLQAFWIRLLEGNNVNLTYGNEFRRHTDNSLNVLRTPAESKRKVLGLYIAKIPEPIESSPTSNLSRLVEPVLSSDDSGPFIADETIIYQDPYARDEFDPYDSGKAFQDGADLANIYTKAGNNRLSIQGFSDLYDKNIALWMHFPKQGHYRLGISKLSGFDPGDKIWLFDKLKNTCRLLLLEDVVSLEQFEAGNIQRYSIQFGQNTKLTSINEQVDTELKVWTGKDGNVRLRPEILEELEYSISDLSGKLVYRGIPAVSPACLVPGNYLIRSMSYPETKVVEFSVRK